MKEKEKEKETIEGKTKRSRFGIAGSAQPCIEELLPNFFIMRVF